MEKIDIL